MPWVQLGRALGERLITELGRSSFTEHTKENPLFRAWE